MWNVGVARQDRVKRGGPPLKRERRWRVLKTHYEDVVAPGRGDLDAVVRVSNRRVIPQRSHASALPLRDPLRGVPTGAQVPSSTPLSSSHDGEGLSRA